MAAKLTFEASMQGMEKVLDLLKQAEQRMNDAGRIGTYSFDGVDKKVKDLSQSLELINKSQSGLGGFFKSFDEVNKRSSDFLGKAHKGIIDAMKFEVKAFEGETDKILNKIKEAEKELLNFKARKSAMSEQEYQEGLSNRQREINQNNAEMVAVRTQQLSMQQEIKNREIVGGSFGQKMTELTGTPFTASVRNQMMLRGAAGLVGAVPAALEATAALTGGILHQRYGKDMNAFIAQQSLAMNAAQAAMNFNPNAILLQQHGLGFEQQMMNDPNFERNLRSAHAAQTWWSQGLKGAAAGTLTGATVGGLATLWSAGAGAAPGAILGGISGGVIGSLQGLRSEKSYDQMKAEIIAELREKDKVFQKITEPGAKALQQQIEQLGSGQRMFGDDFVYSSVSALSSQGISADRSMPLLREFYRHGKNARDIVGQGGIRDLDLMMRKMGIPAEMAQQIIRYSATTGTGVRGGLDATKDLLATAGFSDIGSYDARLELQKQVALMTAERGPGVSQTDVGAGLASVTGAAGSSAGYMEQVTQGKRGFETVSGLLKKSGSMANTALISILRQLGVSNAVAIDAFIDMGLADGNDKAINALARYVNKDPSEVRAALKGIGRIWGAATKDVLGADFVNDFKKKTGVDVATLKTQGIAGADFESATGKGGTEQAMSSIFEGVTAGAGAGVQGSQQVVADEMVKYQSSLETQINVQVKRIADSASETVVKSLSGAVLKGFLDTAEAVRQAGDKLAGTKASNNSGQDNSGKTFKGVKGQ